MSSDEENDMAGLDTRGLANSFVQSKKIIVLMRRIPALDLLKECAL